jgi:DNA polymerase alpha-associated DNA helicase A
LDYRAKNGDDGALLKDVGKELEGHLSDLAKKRGEKGAVKGKERGGKWQEVRDLRKEHRQREGKVVGNVVKAAQVSQPVFPESIDLILRWFWRLAIQRVRSN